MTRKATLTPDQRRMVAKVRAKVGLDQAIRARVQRMVKPKPGRGPRRIVIRRK